MMYFAYQAHADLTAPLRGLAHLVAPRTMPGLMEWVGNTWAIKSFGAACELIARASLSHSSPPFGIAKVRVGNDEVTVREESTYATPFGRLLHFKKDIELEQPRVLLVAPLSGHFATLLRNTVETLLSDHDVYITDWQNARDIGLRHGRFGLDEYIDHIIRFLEVLGPRAHVVAVCQPCVQVLAAAAIMAEAKSPAEPASITLMAGPIDTRINPTKVNELAKGRSIHWFERNLISRVPPHFPGAMRRVYPGFVQLTAFMSMNIDRHVKAHLDLFHHLCGDEREKAEATKTFYDEYFAVLDLPAEFYLETVQHVFQEHRLASGKLTWRGHKVDPGKIKRTALLTVEGGKDDICSVGQTLAAQDLCSGIRPYMKRHHLQIDVGHYGVFSGRRWTNQIYPTVRNFILANR